MELPELSTPIIIIAPLTYLGLLVYALVITLMKPIPGSRIIDLGSLDLSTDNLRAWGYAAGIIIFLILLVFHEMGLINVSVVDFIGSRLLLGPLLGFILGIALMETARWTKNINVFAALFVMFVVAGSLSSFYVFAIFEDIRANLVLATMFFLLGVILDYIIRNGLSAVKGLSQSDKRSSDW